MWTAESCVSSFETWFWRVARAVALAATAAVMFEEEELAVVFVVVAEDGLAAVVEAVFEESAAKSCMILLCIRIELIHFASRSLKRLFSFEIREWILSTSAAVEAREAAFKSISERTEEVCLRGVGFAEAERLVCRISTSHRSKLSSSLRLRRLVSIASLRRRASADLVQVEEVRAGVTGAVRPGAGAAGAGAMVLIVVRSWHGRARWMSRFRKRWKDVVLRPRASPTASSGGALQLARWHLVQAKVVCLATLSRTASVSGASASLDESGLFVPETRLLPALAPTPQHSFQAYSYRRLRRRRYCSLAEPSPA